MTGIAANAQLGRILGTDSADVSQPLERDPEGAWRGTGRDGESGLFISNRGQLDDETRRIFATTERLWPVLAPLVRQHFFNFWFITVGQAIRISPPDWAHEIESDHDFGQDIFYRLATPEANPDREAVWTPVYFDSIWQHWMTSLLVPLYVKDRFLGVTGSDFILDRIFADMERLSAVEDFGIICLFDDKGNIIVHPDHMEAIRRRHAEMNTTPLLHGCGQTRARGHHLELPRLAHPGTPHRGVPRR